MASRMSATAIAEDVSRGSISAEDVARATLRRIETESPRINAFTAVTAERALAKARDIDRRRSNGEPLGPLAGVPYAVKNLFDVTGLPTRAGSKINRERAPATRDAVLIERLDAADAVLVGALNMGEYAYDFTGENVHDGNCLNPLDTSRMTGGSSSGSGAAVAAGLTPISLGSDTNGSIRVPSSFCGIFGLKPTYGRLPRTRTFPFCDSLDHLGPLARNTRDLALAYDVLQGHDRRDPACAPRQREPVSALLARGTEGLRIAVAGGFFDTADMPEAATAVRSAAQALGASRSVVLDGAEEARAAAFIITNAESAALHLPRLQTRADDYDPDTRDRFLAGAMLPASWLLHAQRVRRWFHDKTVALFRDVDIILAPATPCVAPKGGGKEITLRGETLPLRPNIGLFTQPISCIGLPVACVPIDIGPLPIGVQLIAAPWREDLCLRAASALEAAQITRR